MPYWLVKNKFNIILIEWSKDYHLLPALFSQKFAAIKMYEKVSFIANAF